MIYLDNSATTNKKPRSVIKAVKNAVKKYSFNSGRSGYFPATRNGLKIYELRKNVCKLINFNKPENVIITKNCTEALNLAIIGSAKNNGHIITTAYEHNSVLRTLSNLNKTKNIEFTIIKPDKNGQISVNKINKSLQVNTYMLIINHTSNVTGDTQNLLSLGKFCKENNLIFMVDSAQSLGHFDIDIKKYNINLLAIAGHKSLYGPQGIGLLVYNHVILKPIIFGGTGTVSNKIIQPSSSPESYESGTLNFISINGLNEGIKFVIKNKNKIYNKITSLSKILINKLSQNKNVILYSNNLKSGVVSFIIKNKSSGEIADELYKKYKICVRSGLHCAPLIHKKLKSFNSGLVRISISFFNTKNEILKCVKAINKISSI